MRRSAYRQLLNELFVSYVFYETVTTSYGSPVNTCLYSFASTARFDSTCARPSSVTRVVVTPGIRINFLIMSLTQASQVRPFNVIVCVIDISFLEILRFAQD